MNAKSLNKIFELVKEDEKIKFKVNLENQLFSTENHSINESFDINNFNKSCLTNGYDGIDYLNSKKERIIEFEKLQKI